MNGFIYNGILWHINGSHELLGYIPSFLSCYSDKKAAKQFEENYVGGWSPFPGFTVTRHEKAATIEYPGDPPIKSYAYALFQGEKGNEHIYVFPYSWVMVVQDDGSHEISRMD